VKYTLILLFSLQWTTQILGQARLYTPVSELVSLDTFKGKPQPLDFSMRKKVFAIAGLSAYTAASIALYSSWYKQFEQREFHFFNDWGEWKNMDKAGHSYSAYMQASLIKDLALWAGYEPDKALGIGVMGSVVGQLTIEVMDGFSSGWGFSLTDLGANIVGTGGYYLQQRHWGEQRFRMKMSYWPVQYDRTEYTNNTWTLERRADDLYGASGIEKFLKDYNGQTIWISTDMESFFPESRWPDFLDFAIGYSARNIYGGFRNEWVDNKQTIIFSEDEYPRARQWVLALDYDWSSIKPKTGFGKTLFKIMDVFKFPAPGVSYDSQAGWAFHLLYLN